MSDERAPVTFREWKAALAAEPWAADNKAQAARDIIGFLRHCKVLRSPASIATAKGYIAEMEAQARNAGASPRGALRWLFMAARKAGGRAAPPNAGAGTRPPTRERARPRERGDDADLHACDEEARARREIATGRDVRVGCGGCD